MKSHVSEPMDLTPALGVRNLRHPRPSIADGLASIGAAFTSMDSRATYFVMGFCAGMATIGTIVLTVSR